MILSPGHEFTHEQEAPFFLAARGKLEPQQTCGTARANLLNSTIQ